MTSPAACGARAAAVPARCDSVAVSAGWWGLAGRRRFGVLHLPAGRTARGAVVLCPPLLAEAYWGHAAFRDLADRLAAVGLAALRIDYEATGDSPGLPQHLDQPAAWMEDITTAAAELRASGAPWVAAVGMRGSANLLATAAGRRGCGLDAVVLWDPAPSGRRWIREMTLLHRSVVADSEALPGGPESGADTTAVETGGAQIGFAFPTTFVDGLKKLRLDDLPTDVPSLVLTRDGQPPPGLRPGPATMVGAAEGQAELLQTYLETVIVPTATAAVVVDWLTGQAHASVPAPTAMTSCVAPVLDEDERAGYVERVTALGPSELFAVVTEPGTGRTWALTCLMLNSGMLGHAGPHRFHTELARRLAADGVRSVRLDFTGLGESPPAAVPESAPRPAFAPRFLSDLDEAVRALGSADDAPLVTLGLCSGAYHALEAACRHRLAGVVAIHPGYGYGEILVRPGNAEPTRRVGRVLTDRRWVRAAKRTWLGRAVAWRMPGPGWWLLDLTRLQPDLARAIAEARRHVPGIVAFVEEGIVGRPEMWTLLHRRRPPAAIEVDGADHSLWDASARLDVLERARIAVLGFRPLGAPAPDGRAAVS